MFIEYFKNNGIDYLSLASFTIKPAGLACKPISSVIT